MFFNRKPKMIGKQTEKEFIASIKRIEKFLETPADQATIDQSMREWEALDVEIDHDAFIEETKKDLQTTVVYN